MNHPFHPVLSNSSANYKNTYTSRQVKWSLLTEVVGEDVVSGCGAVSDFEANISHKVSESDA